MNNLKPTIKLENVSMYYHDKNTVNIGISKINLEFYKGEFVAITGESGSGKTSLLNVIGASLGYHDGELYYDNEPSSYFDDEDRETFRRERIGYVCQNYNLIDSYTLIQNVVASMIISGWNIKDAEVKALEYLDKVGLKAFANKKASKISSGQKQRLGIARALAKETDIILADEPTGNLDSENGLEIVKLLKELSKDHLVIMVTHNVDEALGYATRIIRLSDGHVVLDEKKEVVNYLSASFEEKEKLNPYKIAWSFSCFNRSAKPRRSIFLSIFLLLISITTFIFIGTIISNMDETKTKIYDSSAFLNEQTNRLIVMKDDESFITSADVEKIKNLKYVLQVDKFDLVNDFNYYLEGDYILEPQALYEYDANGFPIESTVEIRTVPKFLNKTNFMKSISCIDEKDIIVGTIPSKLTEIAIYGEEEDLGKTIKIYFQINGSKNWDVQQYISFDMTVSCVLKHNKDFNEQQVYYSYDFCRQMIANASATTNHILYYYLQNGENLVQKTKRVYLFTDNIGENNCYISQSFFGESRKRPISGNVGLDSPHPDNLLYHVSNYDELMSASMLKLDVSLFETYFKDVDSKQFTVYIEDYAYTDEVIKEINNLGYTAMSSYRASTLEYDYDLLNSRNVTIIVCVISLLVIFALTLFVLVAFLGLNQNDYLLLRLIGMNKKTMYWTNLFEMLVTAFVMFILAIICTYILDFINVQMIHDIVKYMVWYQFIIIFIVDLFIVWATTNRFNNSLQKKTKTGFNE